MSLRVATGVIGAGIGFAVGAGPAGAQWGWAIGSVVGNVIDPQVIRGPSIGDVAQQTSQEGVPIPIVFGMSPPMAGNVIATSEPRIVKKKSSGKGGPKIETETVYRTYAIGICEGPIGGVIRVWRNNTKVYDVLDPEFTDPTVLSYPLGIFDETVPARNAQFLENARFFLGAYDQVASPDLEAVFGAGTTPSYRGLAYMVMADEDLTDTRGMVPQWTVQVADTIDEVLILAMADNRCMRSIDGGLTWDVQTPAGLSGTSLDSVAYSPELGRVVGIDRSTASPQVIRYSDDFGLTWESAASPAPSGTFPMGQIIWSSIGQRFVVMNNGGSASHRIGMSSLDGSTWTVTSSGLVSSNSAIGMVETDAHVVAIFANRAAYSSDGTTWNSGSIGSPGTNSVSDNQISFSPDLGVMVWASGNGTTRYSSSFPWTSWTSGTGAGSSPGAAWSDSLGIFAAGGFQNPYVSNDGVNWTAGTSEGGTCRDVVWSEHYGRFIAVGNNTGPQARVYTSTDGQNWTVRVNTGNYTIWSVVETITQVSATDGVPLVEVIQRICQRAGLTAADIDLALLNEAVLVRGFIITNQYPVSQALLALGQVYQFDPSKYDGQIHFIPRGGNSVATITEAVMVDDDEDIEESKRSDSIQIPRTLHLNYHDADTDGLTTIKQVSERAGDRRAVGEMSMQSAVVMSADLAAQTVAIAHSVMIENQKGELRFSLPDNYIGLVPSDPIVVQWNGKSERACIHKLDILDGYLSYICLRDRQSAYTSEVEGLPPPVIPTPPSQVVGPTAIAPLDIPILRDADDSVGLSYYVAISGLTESWAGAVVELSYDGGANYIDSRESAVGTTMGQLITSLPDHPAEYPDGTNEFTVRLYSPTDELLDSTLAGTLNRENLAAIGSPTDGWELVNFADVTQDSSGDWVLSNLLRGRKDTTTQLHAIGAQFVLLDRNVLGFEAASITDIGRTMTFRATSAGQPTSTGTVVSMVYAGNSQTERHAAYLQVTRDGNDLNVSWQGVGRLGGGGSAIHGSFFTGYRVTFDDGADQIVVDTTAESITQDVSTLSSPVTVSVQQVNSLTGAGPSIEVIVT